MYKIFPIKDLPNYIPYPDESNIQWAVMVTSEWPNPAIGNTKIDHRSPGPQKAAHYMIGGVSYAIVSMHPTKGSADKALRKLNKALPEASDYPYQLFITESQAQILVDALDLYSRIGAGQLEEIAHVLRINPGTQHEKVAAVEELAKEASNCWMGRAGGHHGISSEKVHDAFRVAWDLQQVIRHRLAWDRNPKGGIQVNFDEPLKSSKEPLATIKRT